MAGSLLGLLELKRRHETTRAAVGVGHSLDAVGPIHATARARHDTEPVRDRRSITLDNHGAFARIPRRRRGIAARLLGRLGCIRPGEAARVDRADVEPGLALDCLPGGSRHVIPARPDRAELRPPELGRDGPTVQIVAPDRADGGLVVPVALGEDQPVAADTEVATDLAGEPCLTSALVGQN